MRENHYGYNDWFSAQLLLWYAARRAYRRDRLRLRLGPAAAGPGRPDFVDLRDRTGLLQLAFGDDTDQAVFEKAASLRSEYVVAAVGTVREREARAKKSPPATLRSLSLNCASWARRRRPPLRSWTAPAPTRCCALKYRYLDLRRPELQKNLMFRHKVAKITRDYFDENGFIEIETPP